MLSVAGSLSRGGRKAKMIPARLELATFCALRILVLLDRRATNCAKVPSMYASPFLHPQFIFGAMADDTQM